MNDFGANCIYFNENLEIVSGNKEFYIFFVRPGKSYAFIHEIVLEEEKDDFLDFMRTSKGDEDFRLFHFQKNTGEQCLCITTVAWDAEKNAHRLTLIDFKGSLKQFRRAMDENNLYAAALGITDEYVFTYRKSTGVFTMHHFIGGNKVVLYDKPLDDFREDVVRSGCVLGKNLPLFQQFIENLRALEKESEVVFDSSIRSTGMVTESLVFKSVLVDCGAEKVVVGRVVPTAEFNQLEKTNSLIEELKFDSLTNVYNKKAITEYATQRFMLNKTDDIALIIVDLDHFKPVNDAYGHMAGDKVLATTGEILKEIARETGIVGRYGGDEFLMVLGGMESELVLRGTLHSILVQVRNAFENMFDDIQVTASVGCAVQPRNGMGYEELFKKADFCLYRAKDKGRNRYVFFRDDLHGELYKKATEAKADGIKYDDREVKELSYMASFMQTLGSKPFNAIKTVLEHMKETYNLDDISIYYGEDMNRVYTIGAKSDAQKEVRYVFSDGFKAALGANSFVHIDFPEELKDEYGEFSAEMKKRGIFSTIQCLLCSGNDVKGLVTFDRTKEAARWAEYEKNCTLMFAYSLNLLPDSTKINFALYSKLKD